MNAGSISTTAIVQLQENAGDSGSDTHSDDIPEYYQPISETTDDDDGEGGDSNEASDENHGFVQLSLSANGCHDYRAENGMRALNLSENGNGDSVEAEDDEERRRAELDAAMRRAFEEDENRRYAPLTADTAMRVMEAMRGVSFGGFTPDWARRVPEDQWIDQLRRLGQSPHSVA
ncbi:hypothetical protein Ancab_007201 [Ancistrocladus abbreviatus]